MVEFELQITCIKKVYNKKENVPQKTLPMGRGVNGNSLDVCKNIKFFAANNCFSTKRCSKLNSWPGSLLFEP